MCHVYNFRHEMRFIFLRFVNYYYILLLLVVCSKLLLQKRQNFSLEILFVHALGKIRHNFLFLTEYA
jgi:hypothetical protein